ncbi:MAG: glutathione peroxidase [Acidimicrobiales bacterium]|jgi:glutathione peroxidase|nr:glutathione peroxidase [Acidimicrobiales bacterium]HLV91285.1 glutathione peroxidase [Acidimicrobiia bacterium]
MSDLRTIPLTTIEGDMTTLGAWSDQVVLIVNVASRCGLTPQYEALEEMHRRFSDRGFSVLGFPSNQFRQELGSEDEIKDFCSTRYDVTFPLFARVKVNGRSQHPLYARLTETPDPSGKAGRVRWNFEKFLVTPDDRVMRWRPTTEPDDPEIVAAIESELKALGR